MEELGLAEDKLMHNDLQKAGKRILSFLCLYCGCQNWRWALEHKEQKRKQIHQSHIQILKLLFLVLI